jgi:hypothetical protein
MNSCIIVYHGSFCFTRQGFKADFSLGIKQDASLYQWQNAMTGINKKRTPK